MTSLTAGWVLSGASAQWHNARPGKVAQTLIEGEYANPVLVLDEVDKAGGDHRYDPMGALYRLLEPDTAEHFRDEYIDVDIDATHILWIATANDETTIPEPILNRMNVYSIERPDAEGSRRIALVGLPAILDQHRWPFPPEPAEGVLDKLATIPPRDMKKLLLDAFGKAQLAERDYLVPEDIDATKLCGRRARSASDVHGAGKKTRDEEVGGAQARQEARQARREEGGEKAGGEDARAQESRCRQAQGAEARGGEEKRRRGNGRRANPRPRRKSPHPPRAGRAIADR